MSGNDLSNNDQTDASSLLFGGHMKGSKASIFNGIPVPVSVISIKTLSSVVEASMFIFPPPGMASAAFLTRLKQSLFDLIPIDGNGGANPVGMQCSIWMLS